MRIPPISLAQLTGPSAADVPPLPSAPIWELWVLEQPLPLGVALGAIGLLLGLALLTRGRRGPGLAALLLGLVLGAGVFLIGQSVETRRERVRARTTALIQATASADGAGMRAVMAPDGRLAPNDVLIGRYAGGIDSLDTLIAQVEQNVPQWIGRVVILETRAALDGTRLARSQVRLRGYAPGDQLLGHSWWEIDWQLRDGEWVAVEIEPLWVQGG